MELRKHTIYAGEQGDLYAVLLNKQSRVASNQG